MSKGILKVSHSQACLNQAHPYAGGKLEKATSSGHKALLIHPERTEE